MLTKQSIRSNIQILANGEPISKDDLIAMSENWSEKEETLFRKMIKQGGVFKIQETKFNTSVPDKIYNNKGEVEK